LSLARQYCHCSITFNSRFPALEATICDILNDLVVDFELQACDLPNPFFRTLLIHGVALPALALINSIALAANRRHGPFAQQGASGRVAGGGRGRRSFF